MAEHGIDPFSQRNAEKLFMFWRTSEKKEY